MKKENAIIAIVAVAVVAFVAGRLAFKDDGTAKPVSGISPQAVQPAAAPVPAAPASVASRPSYPVKSSPTAMQNAPPITSDCTIRSPFSFSPP